MSSSSASHSSCLTAAEFRRQKSTEARAKEAEHIRSKYPDRFPIVACPDPSSKDLPPLDRQKFLTPNITVGEMIYVLRKRMHLAPEKALFVFCEDGTLPKTSSYVSDVYASHKHVDDYLYLIFCQENTFG